MKFWVTGMLGPVTGDNIPRHVSSHQLCSVRVQPSVDEILRTDQQLDCLLRMGGFSQSAPASGVGDVYGALHTSICFPERDTGDHRTLQICCRHLLPPVLASCACKFFADPLSADCNRRHQRCTFRLKRGLLTALCSWVWKGVHVSHSAIVLNALHGPYFCGVNSSEWDAGKDRINNLGMTW